jgi:hypothetical protein
MVSDVSIWTEGSSQLFDRVAVDYVASKPAKFSVFEGDPNGSMLPLHSDSRPLRFSAPVALGAEELVLLAKVWTEVERAEVPGTLRTK